MKLEMIGIASDIQQMVAPMMEAQRRWESKRKPM